MPSRITGLASTELALTNKRIIGRVGMFRRRKLSLPHRAIELVKSQRGLLGMMFNYGTLIILGRDGTRIKFRGIAHPLDMELQCNEAAEIATLGRSLSKSILEMPASPRMETRLPVLETKAAPAKPPAPSPVLQAPPEVPMTIKKHKDPNAW